MEEEVVGIMTCERLTTYFDSSVIWDNFRGEISLRVLLIKNVEAGNAGWIEREGWEGKAFIEAHYGNVPIYLLIIYMILL